MVDKNTLRSWLMTGLKPTQTQFWAWLDSYWHKDEQIPQSSIQNLIQVLNAKAEKSQFDAHKTDPNAHPNLLTQARIVPTGQMIVYKIAPNTDLTKKEPGDYCVGVVENSVVNGNWNGGDEQLKSSYE